MRSRLRFTPEGEGYRQPWERSERCGKLTYSTKKVAKEKARTSAKMSGEDGADRSTTRRHCPCGWSLLAVTVETNPRTRA